MLSTIRGEPTDEIPWAPRMDLWYIAQRARGTLPQGLQGLNMSELSAEIDVACHAVRADYTRPVDPRDWALRGLGIENHPDYPYRVELRGLEMDFHSDGERFSTTIHTGAGDVVIHMIHTGEMRRDGISMPFVKQFAIRSSDDFEAVARIFEHVEVVPTPGAYAAFHRRVGARGVAVANGCVAASPMHHILHELVPQEQFFYLYADERDALRDLAGRMEAFHLKALEAVLRCEAEVVLWGANYDQDLTWPAFFQSEIAPSLRRVADRLHAAGRFLLTHTDGENMKLLPHYPACGFDVAESVCPAPMTRCSLEEVRAGMGPKVTIWGGIPSVALLRDSMDDTAFDRHLGEVFDNIGLGSRLILGVSDMVPPDAELDRLEKIKQRIRDFGGVRPGKEA